MHGAGRGTLERDREREDREAYCTGPGEGAGSRARVRSEHLAPATLLGKGITNQVPGPGTAACEGREAQHCCALQCPSSRPQGIPGLKGMLILLPASWGRPSGAQEARPGAWANRHLVFSVAGFWGPDFASLLIPA